MDVTLSEDELASQIEIEADSLIPYPLDEVSLDFESLDVNESDPTKINIANNLKIKKCDDNALNNVLKYNKYKVHVIYDNGQLWLNGNSVRKLFKYKSLLCITSNIQKNNVKKCREFDNDVLDNNNMLPLHRSFSNTVYISEIGVMSFAILYKLKI